MLNDTEEAPLCFSNIAHPHSKYLANVKYYITNKLLIMFASPKYTEHRVQTNNILLWNKFWQSYLGEVSMKLQQIKLVLVHQRQLYFCNKGKAWIINAYKLPIQAAYIFISLSYTAIYHIRWYVFIADFSEGHIMTPWKLIATCANDQIVQKTSSLYSISYGRTNVPREKKYHSVYGKNYFLFPCPE